jgi:putative flippase GtrA
MPFPQMRFVKLGSSSRLFREDIGLLAVLLAMRIGRSLKRYTKFMIVGVMNAFVDLFVLNMLLLVSPVRTEFYLFLFNTVAVGMAIVNSYFWNRKWTFADRSDGSARERKLFFIQALANIALNDLIVVWLSSYLIFAKSVPVFISSNASKGIAMFLSSTLSYFIMRLFVFRTYRIPVKRRN